MTTHSADHRTVTAAQAHGEYVAKCNEIIEIEMVIVYLDNSIASALDRAEPVVAASNDPNVVYISEAFWQLLDLYREATKRRLDLYAARDYAYAVWQSATTASTENAGVDTYVSTKTGEAL